MAHLPTTTQATSRNVNSQDLTPLHAELDATLREVARKRTLITYADVAVRFHAQPVEPDSPLLAHLLCHRVLEDVEAGRPLVVSLVVNRQSNRPGRGFFALAGSFYRFRDEEQFWIKEVEQSHLFYQRRSATTRRDATNDSTQRVARQSSLAKGKELSADKEFILSFFA